MRQVILEEFEKARLLEEIQELKAKLSKKKAELTKAKSRLATCREKLLKMKATVSYQRARLLQLYRGEEQS